MKLSCRPLALTSHKAFLKSKKMSETSLPTSFSVWFLKKISYYVTKFRCLIAFTSRSIEFFQHYFTSNLDSENMIVVNQLDSWSKLKCFLSNFFAKSVKYQFNYWYLFAEL